MDRLKMAVVGVGALGRHHARLLAEMADVELVAVADPQVSQGQQVAADHGAMWLADHRGLLEDGFVDAVSIVVPTHLHRSIAEDFLSRGLPVFVEKPIAPTVAEGDALCRHAEQQGTLLQIGHIERFNPAFRELARQVVSPKYIRAERMAPYAFRSMDISVVHDLMIHDLDLIRCLNPNRVVRVEAFGICLFGGHVDTVQARLTFQDGCLADLVANRISPTVRRSFQVWSPSGCATADLQEQTLQLVQPGEALSSGLLPRELASKPGADLTALKDQVFRDFLPITSPAIPSRNALEDELRSFVDAIRHGTDPVVSGRDGLAALELAEQICDAVAAHEWNGSPDGFVGPNVYQLLPNRHAA